MRSIFLLFSALLFIQCGSMDQKTPVEGSVAKDLKVSEFSEKMKANPGVVLDVRTPEEVSKGKIAGAEEMDFYGEEFDAQLATLDQNKTIYVYCASGGRSGKTMDKLNGMGFKTVYNLEGGMGAWLGANMPVEK